MKGKNLLCLTFVTLMLLGVVMIGSVGAQSTTIGVEPVDTIDPALGPGSTFTVEIWIRNIADLAGVEFKLGYDTSVLTATLIEDGGIFAAPFPLISNIDDAAGVVHYSTIEGFGLPSFNGDGRAAIITFSVDSSGDSVLDLYDTKLGDSSSPPEPIIHDALDGYFSNIPPTTPPSITLARRSAWPEHHHYVTMKDEDSSNDLFAIVYNDGTVDTWVKVVFTITDPTGTTIGDIETDTILLPTGAIYGHEKDVRYWTAFTPPSEGKYYVSAVCWADTDGDEVPDQPMGKIKAFNFAVVP